MYSEYLPKVFITNKFKKIIFIHIVVKHMQWNARHRAKQNCVP